MYTLGQNRSRASADGKRNVLNPDTGQSIGTGVSSSVGSPKSTSTKQNRSADSGVPGRVRTAQKGAIDPAKKVQTGSQDTSVVKEANHVTNAASGAATGATVGSYILPGWGTAIGAVVGGIAGALF